MKNIVEKVSLILVINSRLYDLDKDRWYNYRYMDSYDQSIVCLEIYKKGLAEITEEKMDKKSLELFMENNYLDIAEIIAKNKR